MSEHCVSNRLKMLLAFAKPLLLFLLAMLSYDAIASEPKVSSYVKTSGEYYVFGLSSSEVLSNKDRFATGGIARGAVDWIAFEDSNKNTGSLKLKVDYKHSLTDVSPSQFTMANVGGFGLIQPAFSDIGFRLANLYWKQEFNTQDTELMIGFLDSTDYIDMYALGNPYFGFSNLQFSTGSGSIAIPDESTFGLSMSHMMSDNYYATFSFSDAKANSTEPFEGAKNFFIDNQYFKSLEVGWVSSKDSFLYQNSHVTVWHSDGPKEKASENYGANFSSIYKMGDWVPFIRVGVANGPEALYKSSVVAGTGFLGLGSGTLGVAVGWGKPNAPVDDVYNSEVYYRMGFGPVSFTPNIQYLSSLPFNSEADSAWVFGVRGRISFSI